MLGGFSGTFRELISESDDPAHGKFEKDVNELLGDSIRFSKEYASLMWSALANVDWVCGDLEVSYSFRAAGDLIAAIRQEGDYMDWYCSGPFAHVDDYIASTLAERGWEYVVNE